MTTIALDQIDWRDRRGRRVRARRDDAGALVFTPLRRSLRDWVVWASGKSNYFISKFENFIWNAAAYTPATSLDFALWTSALSASSTGATAGECSYSGYARVAVTCNTTNFPTSSGGAAIANGTTITFASNGGGSQTATYIAVLEHGTNNILYWGSISSTVIGSGVTPSIAASALSSSEA